MGLGELRQRWRLARSGEPNATLWGRLALFLGLIALQVVLLLPGQGLSNGLRLLPLGSVVVLVLALAAELRRLYNRRSAAA